MFKEIKYAYQRVRYGYDERIFWNMDYYIYMIIKKAFPKFIDIEGMEEILKGNEDVDEAFTELHNILNDCKLDEDEKIAKALKSFGNNSGYFWF